MHSQGQVLPDTFGGPGGVPAEPLAWLLAPEAHPGLSVASWAFPPGGLRGSPPRAPGNAASLCTCAGRGQGGDGAALPAADHGVPGSAAGLRLAAGAGRRDAGRRARS